MGWKPRGWNPFSLENRISLRESTSRINMFLLNLPLVGYSILPSRQTQQGCNHWSQVPSKGPSRFQRESAGTAGNFGCVVGWSGWFLSWQAGKIMKNNMHNQYLQSIRLMESYGPKSCVGANYFDTCDILWHFSRKTASARATALRNVGSTWPGLYPFWLQRTEFGVKQWHNHGETAQQSLQRKAPWTHHRCRFTDLPLELIQVLTNPRVTGENFLASTKKPSHKTLTVATQSCGFPQGAKVLFGAPEPSAMDLGHVFLQETPWARPLGAEDPGFEQFTGSGDSDGPKRRKLVGGLEHICFFHILEMIIPTDFHIFQRVWHQKDRLKDVVPSCQSHQFIPMLTN